MDSGSARLQIAAHSTVDSFVALRAFDLAMKVDPHTGRPDAAVFRFDFASIQTGNADRDQAMNLWPQTNRYRAVTLDGQVPVDTRDYGLPVITKYLDRRVDPVVRLQFHLPGRRSPLAG